MTVGIFYLLSRQDQKQDIKLEVQLFLTCLLVPLFFAGLLYFCLMLEASALGLIIDFAINEAESIGRKVAIGLFGWLQWKMLISLQKCSTAKAGSHVFLFLG